MIETRRSGERGHVNHGWLDSYHSFSFAQYYDEAHMQYSVLRVINEDVIAGGAGFGLHPHKDMEIVTYIISGQLRHQDSMGNTSVIAVGDVQRMTAGTGVRHSEFNASSSDAVHLLQIWIMPNTNGLTPSYEEKHFSNESKTNQWRLIVSETGNQESVSIHQDVNIYASLMDANTVLAAPAKSDRHHYIQVVKGELVMGEHQLLAGDALKITGVPQDDLTALTDVEVVWFDLPNI